MLSFSGSLKVFVALEACDLRKGFNGLHALVTERLGEDPRGGALFVFANRRRTRLKILCWDGTGLWGKRHAEHHWRRGGISVIAWGYDNYEKRTGDNLTQDRCVGTRADSGAAAGALAG